MAAPVVHGEVSTRGRAACRLTSLPRRQAVPTPHRSRGWRPGRARMARRAARQAARRITQSAAQPVARRTRRGAPMSTPGAGHRPVLLERVLTLLAPALDRNGAVLVDATLGRAGHAQALLDAHPGLVLIGLDTDAAAVEESGRLLARYGDRVSVTRAVYDQVTEVLNSQGRTTVDGFLFDLGVSSPQLDEPAR